FYPPNSPALGCHSWTCGSSNRLLLFRLRTNTWLLRSRPMPELPEPPWRVLAYKWGRVGNADWPPSGPTWYAWSPTEQTFYDCDDDKLESDYYEGPYHDRKHPWEMIVIEHPRNDPEAVALISAAKEGK